MKHYFKYSGGYVNIDDENLYLTNSGNWQEARGLEEKSPSTVRANNNRIIRMKGFVYGIIIVVSAAAFLFYKALSFGLLLSFGALAYKLFDYFGTEFGKRYKIPLNKLKEVKIEGETMTLIFLNGRNEVDRESVENVDARLKDFLSAYFGNGVENLNVRI